MLITAKGILLKMAVDQLRDIGRATQGVRLIRVGDNDRVVAVARVPSAWEEREANGVEAEPSPVAESAVDEALPVEENQPEPAQPTEPTDAADEATEND